MVMVMVCFSVFGQVTIAGWDVSTMTGGLNNFGPSPFTATTTNSNVTVGPIIRGSGVVTGGGATGASRGWGGIGWNNSTAATNIAQNKFFTFQIQVKLNYTLSLTSLDPLDYRRSSSGAANMLIQYEKNGGGFIDIVTLNLTSSGSGGAHAGPVDLSSLNALQNLSPSDVITFRFVPYNASGSAGTFYIYDVDNTVANDLILKGFVTLNSSNSNTSDIIFNTGFTSPTNINYTSYQATDITDVNSIEVAQFTIRDGGASAPDADALGTTLTALTFSLSNSANIRRVALYDGTTELGEVAGSAAPSFTGLSLSAPDNGTKTFSLRVTYNTTVTDNQQPQFIITNATPDISGSVFAAGDAGGASSSTIGDDNKIEVIATALAFVQNTTTPTGVNVAMSPAPTVSANDANGNRDLDFVANVDVTSSGTLSTSPVTVAPIAGLASFNANIIHTASSTGLQLTAASTGLSSATSNLFDITTASSASDYFRSKANGNWGSFSSWESSPDNNTWIDATLIPDENANTITIRNDHTITVAAAATADQVVVESGGSLVLNANFTLADGAGTDLDVNGTLINTSGSHTITGTISQNGGSLYQHNRNGSAVLNATWSATSTAEIIGSISSSPTNLGQSFGNFTWNCTSQSGNVGLGNPSGFNITGNLTITSTGGATNRAVRFTAGTSYSLNIGGDLILNGGHLGLSSGSGDMTLTVSGNVSVSNSSELYLSQGGSGSNTLQIAGNLSVNSGTITETGSSANCKIEFNKSGSQSISLAAATISNDLNYVIASASATTLLSNIPVNTGRTLTINGTLNASTNQITGAGGVAANGTLISSHLNGIGSTGTLANTGTNTFGSTSTITYDAAGAQTFEGRTDYANVVINGGGDKSLNGNAVLSGTLTITNGNVVLGANNLTVENTSGGNTTSYIKTDGTGIFTVNNITTAKTLPVGNAKYNPLIIENGNGHNWSVKVIDGLTADPGFNTDKAVLLQWDITPSINPPSSGADITFQFDQSTQGGVSFNINNDIQAWHNPNNGGWMRSRFPSTPSIVNASTATVKISGITEFSRYALSNVDGPLPVNFLSFSGYKSGSVNKLQWTTASEQNCLGFEVQRSTDGINFSSIGFVNTLAIGGNSTDRLSYNFNDNNVAGEKQYYRIRQVDIDNHGRLSNVILLKGSKPLIVSIDGIYPNPANNEINVLLAAPARDKATLIVTDISGRVLLQQLVNVETGINSIPVNISRFASGTYLIKLAGQTSVESAGAKFIKQ